MIEEYFKKLRFDKNHHLGGGDIRLTIGQQEELISMLPTGDRDCDELKEALRDAVALIRGTFPMVNSKVLLERFEQLLNKHP